MTLTIATTTCAHYNATQLNGGAYAFGSSTCATITTASSSSSPLVKNGFTYGEMVITTFLFLIFVIQIFNSFYYLSRGFRIKRKR